MGWESVLGAVAGPIIGGLFGSSAADSQAGAIQQSGADQAAAGKYAVDQQMRMFNQQQANSNAKYNQTRGDLSQLFGGNVAMPNNQNLVAASPAATPLSSSNFDYNKYYANNPDVAANWKYGNVTQTPFNDADVQNPFTTSQLAQRAYQHYLDYGKAEGRDAPMLAGTNPANPASSQPLFQGSIFGNNTGVNNPQLQSLLSGLRGTAGNQLSLFTNFNPQTMAQSIYDKLSMLGAPQRALDRSNLESRLLNQGILTSTPGYNQINSMDQANGQTDLARQIQAMLTAREQQQQYLTNAGGAAGMAGNLESQALGPSLQAAGIEAGVPINSAQPIPSGALGVQGIEAAGKANVDAANITNSFWNSLGNNSTLQNGISSLFSNVGNGNLGLSGGEPINTNPSLSGAQGLFSQLNGFGGGV